MKILHYIFDTINSPIASKDKKKRALCLFRRFVSKLSLPSVEKIIQSLIDQYSSLSVDQRRVVGLFLGNGWKYREASKLSVRLKSMLSVFVASKKILRHKFDAKRERANKFLDTYRIFSPISGQPPMKLKEVLKIEDCLELGTQYWRQILRIVETTIRLEFKHPCFLLSITAPAFLHRPDTAEEVRQAANYIQAGWARLRAIFAKHGYIIKGIRVTELHKDCTPHYHCLISTDAPVDEINRICKLAFLTTDSREEKGADEHRFNIKRLDESGSLEEATSRTLRYVTKYLAKSLFYEGMSGRVKEDRYLICTCRLRVISLFGFKRMPRILRICYRFGINGLDLTDARDYEVEVKTFFGHYEIWIYNKFGEVVTALSTWRWYSWPEFMMLLKNSNPP